MLSKSRRVGVAMVLCAAALAACAPEPQAQAPFAPPAPPAKSGPAFTAAPGDVMVITDACAFRACPPGAPRAVSELVYLGMRSPTEAVFQRRVESRFEGPTRPSGIAGVVVPDRPETPPQEARFIPPRAAGSQILSNTVSEIVVNPVAGAAFGADDIAVSVTEITPGRVVYHLERL
jgi:hypothetical protein